MQHEQQQQYETNLSHIPYPLNENKIVTERLNVLEGAEKETNPYKLITHQSKRTAEHCKAK